MSLPENTEQYINTAQNEAERSDRIKEIAERQEQAFNTWELPNKIDIDSSFKELNPLISILANNMMQWIPGLPDFMKKAAVNNTKEIIYLGFKLGYFMGRNYEEIPAVFKDI